MSSVSLPALGLLGKHIEDSGYRGGRYDFSAPRRRNLEMMPGITRAGGCSEAGPNYCRRTLACHVARPHLDKRLVRLLQTCPSVHLLVNRRLCSPSIVGDAAPSKAPIGPRTMPARSQTMAECFLRRSWAVHDRKGMAIAVPYPYPPANICQSRASSGSWIKTRHV